LDFTIRFPHDADVRHLQGDLVPYTSPVRQVPLVVQVADQFRGLITDGTWTVGAKIPGEHALAADLGVSRATVREALRALSLAGLLEPRVGDGTYVRARDELSVALSRSQPADPLGHALDMRLVLEGAAASRAAAHRTDDDLAAMRRALDERRDADRAGDLAGYVRADAAFHRALVAASGNPLLARLYDALGDLIVDSIHRTTSLPEDPRLDDLHLALAYAVEAGDAARAEQCARDLFTEVAFLSAITHHGKNEGTE
jgi:DNA-binding FadR family transcriptional regulator